MSGREEPAEMAQLTDAEAIGVANFTGHVAIALVERIIADRMAQAWDEGALWAAVECGAIAHEAVPWLAPGDNPYRTPTADSP